MHRSWIRLRCVVHAYLWNSASPPENRFPRGKTIKSGRVPSTKSTVTSLARLFVFLRFLIVSFKNRKKKRGNAFCSHPFVRLMPSLVIASLWMYTYIYTLKTDRKRLNSHDSLEKRILRWHLSTTEGSREYELSRLSFLATLFAPLIKSYAISYRG